MSYNLDIGFYTLHKRQKKQYILFYNLFFSINNIYDI